MHCIMLLPYVKTALNNILYIVYCTHTLYIYTYTRGLHGLKTEARTRPVPEIVWPDPTRPERHS